MREISAEMERDLVIIGGGPAGLAAAVAAVENGVAAEDILILEREPELGGILLQCIHNGFGIHRFGEELSGPEYAARFAKKVNELGIPSLLSTMVLTLHQMEDGRKEITAVSSAHGLIRLKARAVVLANPSGWYLYRRCSTEICQYQGIYARTPGCHSRQR